jgi:hypothetical protein
MKNLATLARNPFLRHSKSVAMGRFYLVETTLFLCPEKNLKNKNSSTAVTGRQSSPVFQLGHAHD